MLTSIPTRQDNHLSPCCIVDPEKERGNSSQCEDIDECASAPCHNNAPCVNEENHYTCRCLPGYTGVTCETDINECALTPCQNGARYVDVLGQHLQRLVHQNVQYTAENLFRCNVMSQSEIIWHYTRYMVISKD